MNSKTTYTLVCRIHRLKPQVIQQPGSKDKIRCPKCGKSDFLEHALKNAQEVVGDEILQEYQNEVAKIFKKSKNISYKPGKIANRKKPDFIFI